METPANTEQQSPVTPEETVMGSQSNPAPQTPYPAPQPPKKKSKKVLWIILGAIVAALAAAAAVWFFVFRSPSVPFKPDTSLIPVYDGKKWGYVDQKGKYVINPQFSEADWFSDGLARVADKDGKYGYIDKKGTYTIPSKYVDATVFHEGLAFVVEEGGRPVCIDDDGEQVFECTTADGVSCFCEGMAPFYTINDKGETKFGYYDKKGNVVINPQFSGAGHFVDGLARVCNNDEKWGYIDKKGTYVINPQFERCRDFYDGLAAFRAGDKWGYIDKKGKYVINPQFDRADNFYNGMAVVCQGEKYGFIDKEGKFVVNPQFEYCSGFTYGDGLALFMNDEEKCGFIDKEGKIVINPQFDAASEFFDGMALVKSNDKCGIIDKKGQYIVNPQFEGMAAPYLDLDSYVESEYYDASKFLTAFLSDFSSSQVDGFSVDGVTLRDIDSHDVYGTKWKDQLWYTSLNIDLDKEITKDISLNDVYFTFLSPTYEYSYDYYSYEKEYNYSAECGYVIYEFDLDNKASDRYKSICSALSNKLKGIYGGTLSNINEEKSYKFLKKLECGNVNFIIIGEHGDILLAVFFDEDEFDKAVSNLTEEEEEVADEEVADEEVYYEYDDEPTAEAVEYVDEDRDM